MSDDSFDEGLPEEPRTPEEEALLRFLSQFGISPGPDGRVDLEELVARAQSMMAAFSSQLAGFGASDSGSGVNWSFTKDVARKITAATPGCWWSSTCRCRRRSSPTSA